MAISLPISSSLFCGNACNLLNLLQVITDALRLFFRLSTTFATALSIPLLRSIGLAPAVTFFEPYADNAWARTVAVVGTITSSIGSLGG